MTQEELFDDLKQFIEATISQRTAGLASADDAQRLERRIDGMGRSIDSLSERIDTVDEKLDIVQEAIAESVAQQEAILKDHEHRITRLEHREARG